MQLPDQTTWYFEHLTPELVQAANLRRILFAGRTRYQYAQIIETGPFGRSLILDGKTQSSEADEWVYHEALVHPAMTAHPGPQYVFIAGGGEGATAREVLRHRTVTHVTMVDLDAEVVALCREHLPNHHQGAFADPRLRLLHQDALAYLEQTDERYDVIVIDIPDPLEAGPAYLLFTLEFYALLRRRLRPGGLVVAQAGAAGPLNFRECFTAVHKTMSTAFPRAYPYRIYMPSFVGMWGFVAAGGEAASDLAGITPREIDERIGHRIASPLRYYDGVTHHGLQTLPKYVRDGLSQESRTITRDHPLYVA